MIIYIYGNDSFRARQFLRKSVVEFKSKRDPQGYNTLAFDALKDEPGRILSELLTAPFLAEKRMVVINNPLSSGDKEFLADLIQKIENSKITETTVAVFCQVEPIGKTNEAKKLETILKKEKYAYEFTAMKGVELARWVEKETKARGGVIGRLASQKLAENVNGDIWLADSVINQLVAYKSGNEILSQDVAQFVDEKIDDNIFSMVDAIVTGNKKTAFKLLNDQRKSGREEGYLFAMILRQFKILTQMRDLWEREDNLTSEQMAKKLSLHPFVCKKSLPMVRRFTLPDLRKIYDELFNIDWRLKHGLAPHDLLIDFFVGKV